MDKMFMNMMWTMMENQMGSNSGSQNSGPSKPYDYWGVPGFGDKLKEALKDFHDEEKKWSPEEMEKRVGQKILKAAKPFEEDDRARRKCSPIEVKIMIEALVAECLSAVASVCYDKPWLFKVNFTEVLLAVINHTFSPGKCFVRCLPMTIEKFVEEAIFTWAEEERLTRMMQDAVEACSVKPTHQKKTVKFLAAAYDDAHYQAPYGIHTGGAQPHLDILKDFVKGWMRSFVDKGYDVLANGFGGTEDAPRDQQILFLTLLFQNLCNTERSCLPHELTSMIAEPPASPWSFIGETAEVLFIENETAQAQANAKKQFKKNLASREQRGLGPNNATPPTAPQPQVAVADPYALAQWQLQQHAYGAVAGAYQHPQYLAVHGVRPY